MDWRLDITLLAERFAVCRMDAGTPPPAWALKGTFTALVRTPEELCIVCPERDAPSRVKKVTGWRALRLVGQLDHTGESGVLLTVVEPLARVGVPVFPVTSCSSGYVLVHDPHVEQALTTLRAWGHSVHEAAKS
jgi:uncharacterized protein